MHAYFKASWLPSLLRLYSLKRFASAAPDALACTALLLPFPELLWGRDVREGPSGGVAFRSRACKISLSPWSVLSSNTNREPGREVGCIRQEEVWSEEATNCRAKSSAQRPGPRCLYYAYG